MGAFTRKHLRVEPFSGAVIALIVIGLVSVIFMPLRPAPRLVASLVPETQSPYGLYYATAWRPAGLATARVEVVQTQPAVRYDRDVTPGDLDGLCFVNMCLLKVLYNQTGDHALDRRQEGLLYFDRDADRWAIAPAGD